MAYPQIVLLSCLLSAVARSARVVYPARALIPIRIPFNTSVSSRCRVVSPAPCCAPYHTTPTRMATVSCLSGHGPCHLFPISQPSCTSFDWFLLRPAVVCPASLLHSVTPLSCFYVYICFVPPIVVFKRCRIYLPPHPLHYTPCFGS